MKPKILYSFARGSAGAAVGIREYVKGTPATCFGCDRLLVAKRGQKKQWHFAHATDAERACAPETALHRLSKVLVREGFERALREKRPYMLYWTCPYCEQQRGADCTRFATRVLVETSAVEGTRGDVVFEGRQKMVVEVVVQHELDARSAGLYASADIPVFVVRPDWATVGALIEKVVSDEAIVARSEKCPSCRAFILGEQLHRRKIEQLRQRLDAWPNIDEKIATIRLGGWPGDVDRWGRTLFPQNQSDIAAHALRLLTLGFHQVKTKPWVFVLDLGDIGSVFALQGGTTDDPIWNNPRPLIKFRLLVAGSHLLYCKVIGEFLERHGVVVDDYFESDETGESGYFSSERDED